MPSDSPSKKAILRSWDILHDDLGVIVDENPSLRGILFGYIAEYKCRKTWFSDRSDITGLFKPRDHDRLKKGDFIMLYKGVEISVEVKSLQSATVKTTDQGYVGKVQCDASDRRTVKFKDGTTLQTTCLLTGEFDLLAVNLFAFEDKWRFIFALNKDLPRSAFKRYTAAQREALLSTTVQVTWPPTGPFKDEPFTLLDEIVKSKSL